MSPFTPRRTAVAIAAAAISTVALPAAAQADGFSCSASALQARVLGQAIEPVRAGAADACPDDTRSLDQLAAPLAGDSATAATRMTGDRAGAATSVSGFRAGGLSALTGELPQVPLPAGIGALPVALPASAQLLGLPSLITVDATQAAQQLVAPRALPDVPLAAADLVETAVSAGCDATGVVFDALSRVEKLTGLGQPLSTDQPIDRTVELVAGQSVDFSQLDIALIDLPDGLSLSDPLVGSILRSALETAVAALPVNSVPAAVGRVVVEPSRREDSSGSVRQLGPRVLVEVLGQEVADVTLGDALVAVLGDVCAAAPAAPVAAAPEAPLSPATQLALSCAKSDLVLTDVLDKDGKVRLVGVAAERFVGQTVDLVLTHGSRTVATAVVGPDGYFRALAPLPANRIRWSNNARYQAAIGDVRSRALKLHRRMRISRMRPEAGQVTIVGRVYGRRADDRVVISRRDESCTKDVAVTTVKPDRDGWWRVTLPVQEGVEAATYRATTEVLNPGSETPFRTFTLPGYVAL